MENKLNSEISARITDLMEKKKLSAYRVIMDIKIPRASFYKCMDGKSEWKVEHLLKISNYFNVTLDYIIKGKGADISDIIIENKKLKETNYQLSTEMSQLHKVAEAAMDYKKIAKKKSIIDKWKPEK